MKSTDNDEYSFEGTIDLVTIQAKLYFYTTFFALSPRSGACSSTGFVPVTARDDDDDSVVRVSAVRILRLVTDVDDESLVDDSIICLLWWMGMTELSLLLVIAICSSISASPDDLPLFSGKSSYMSSNCSCRSCSLPASSPSSPSLLLDSSSAI